MYRNKKIVLLILIGCMLHAGSFAQTIVKTDSVFEKKRGLVLHLGGGISSYVRDITIKPLELPGSVKRLSGFFTARLMWYPKYRLRLGIESGFTNLYSYKIINGNKTGRVNLDAVPLLAVWSMEVVRRLDIYAGFGSYILTTRLDYNGKMKSKDVVLGSNIAVAYTLPVSTKLGLSAEGKWMNIFETKDATIGMQLKLVYKFIQW